MALRSLVIRRSIQVLMAVVEAIAVIPIFVYISGLNREPMNGRHPVITESKGMNDLSIFSHSLSLYLP